MKCHMIMLRRSLKEEEQNERMQKTSISIKGYNTRQCCFRHIPAAFCKANDLYCDARICLKGPCSEEEASLKVCPGGRTKYAVITRGWSKFIADNDLKVGDICTFKLRITGSSSNGVVFDVEVLRKST